MPNFQATGLSAARDDISAWSLTNIVVVVLVCNLTDVAITTLISCQLTDWPAVRFAEVETVVYAVTLG